jgi:hypothetical protein
MQSDIHGCGKTHRMACPSEVSPQKSTATLFKAAVDGIDGV